MATETVLKRVSTIFSINDSEFNKSLSQINTQLKLTKSELSLAAEKMKQFGVNSDDLKTKKELLTKAIATNKEQISKYTNSLANASEKLDAQKKLVNDLKTNKANLNKEYKNAVKVYGEESEEAQKLKDKLDEVSFEYTKQNQILTETTRKYNNHQNQLAKSEKSLVSFEGELKRTNKQLAEQDNKLKQLSKTFTETGEKWQKNGKEITEVGKSLMTLSAPILALGGASLKLAMDFESAFAGVRKTVTATEEEFAIIEQGIRDMAKVMPVAATEIAKVTENAGQLGIQNDKLLSFTKTMVMLGDTTNMSADTASMSLAKFANITKMSQDNFDRLGSSIVALGNNFATTESAIVNMGTNLASAGNQVGMTEPQIMALATTLSSLGLEAQAGGTAFSKLMINMQLAVETGNENLKEFADVSRMTASEFQQAFKEDAAGAIDVFLKGLGNAEELGSSTIKMLDDMGVSEVRLRDALLRTAGANDLLSNSLAIANTAWEENTALTIEAEERYNTTESQMKITLNQMKDMGIEIGSKLLPLAKNGLGVVRDVVSVFANLNSGVQGFILGSAGLIGVAGVTLTTFGKVKETLGGVSKGIGSVIDYFSKYTKSSELLDGANAKTTSGFSKLINFGLTPTGLALTALAGGAFVLYKAINTELIPSHTSLQEANEITNGKTNDLYAAMLGLNNASSITADTLTTQAEKLGLLKSNLDDVNNSAERAGTTFGFYTNTLTEQTAVFGEGLTATFGQTSSAMLQLASSNSGLSVEQVKGFLNNTISFKNQVIEQINSVYESDKQNMITHYKNLGELDSAKMQQELETLEISKNSKIAKIQEQEDTIRTILELASEGRLLLTNEEITNLLWQFDVYGQNLLTGFASSSDNMEILLQGYLDGMTTTQKATLETLVKTGEETLSKSSENLKLEMKDLQSQLEEAYLQGNETKVKQIKQMIETTQKEMDRIEQSNKFIKEDVATVYDELTKKQDEFMDAFMLANGQYIDAQGSAIQATKESKQALIDWNNTTLQNKTATVTYITEYKTNGQSTIASNALGTSYFQGGLTFQNERGYELYQHPTGTKIFNHDASEAYVKNAAKEMVTQFVKKLEGISLSIQASNGNQTPNTINNYLTVNSAKQLSPAEIMRENEKNMRRLLHGY